MTNDLWLVISLSLHNNFLPQKVYTPNTIPLHSSEKTNIVKTKALFSLVFLFYYSLIPKAFGTVTANAAYYSAETLPLLNSDTIIQNYHRADQVQATRTEALIRVKVTDMRKKILPEIPLWVHNQDGQYWQGTTDQNGEVFFLLPNNQSYQINVDQEVNYRKFKIPKEAKHFKTVRVVYMSGKVRETERNDTIFQANNKGMSPTLSRVLVKIKIKDLEEQPLAGEELYFEAKNAGKVYYAKMGTNGEADLMLPKGDTYCVHSYAFPNITCKTYEKSNSSRTSRFELSTISTAAFKLREQERKRLLAERDSIRHAQRVMDSIQIARAGYKNFYLQHAYQRADLAFIEDKVKECAQKDQRATQENKNFFAESGEEIKAMLHRNKDQWPQKRIVANIDCSMYAYIDQLLVWNYSNKEEQANNQYFLFNGFNYSEEEHGEHSRRGIFPVVKNDVQGFFKTIDRIVNFTCRGSRLENVVEALILGAEDKNEQEDLLFIADNYSDVSDLHLLDQLKVPVHVLLTDSQYGVNENYLEIAYRTGGSIHTTREDISAQQLKDLIDGQQLRVGPHIYTFFKGKFLKVNA